MHLLPNAGHNPGKLIVSRSYFYPFGPTSFWKCRRSVSLKLCHSHSSYQRQTAALLQQDAKSELLTRSLSCCFNQRWFQLPVTQLNTTTVQWCFMSTGHVEETQYSIWLCFTLVSRSISCTIEPMCSKDQKKKNQAHEAAEGFMTSDLCLICLQERVSDSHLQYKRKHHSVQLCFI